MWLQRHIQDQRPNPYILSELTESKVTYEHIPTPTELALAKRRAMYLLCAAYPPPTAPTICDYT